MMVKFRATVFHSELKDIAKIPARLIYGQICGDNSVLPVFYLQF
jgi:hypothetical protein